MVGIRAEVLADVEAIRRVNELAFGRPEEADAIDRLRGADIPFVSLVTEDDGAIVGHILFTPAIVDVGQDGEQRVAGMGLAPLGDSRSAAAGPWLIARPARARSPASRRLPVRHRARAP